MPSQPTTITAMYKTQGAVIETKEFGDAAGTDYPGSVADTWCRSGQDTNYSTNVQLITYTSPINPVANTIIIKWDLASIPPDATIDEAILYLYQINSGGDSPYELPVHKIINVNPDISTLTWNKYDGVNSWTGGANGGQGDNAAAEDTQPVNSTINEYKTWTVTDMVQDWVSTPASNYGLLVNSDAVASSNSYRFFASSDDPNPAIRPKLIVTYATVLTGDSEPDGDVDFFDFAAFALYWLDIDCDVGNDFCDGADLDYLGDVDIYDVGELAYWWLAECPPDWPWE